MPDLDDPNVAQMGRVVFVAPRLRRADGRSQPPLPLLHRGRGRAARHAAGDRAAADGRERVQPGRACRRAAPPASGSSCRRPGKDYGLKQNFWFDSRRDVIAATDGALTYLQKLYAQFNDWQLALAAYNWGEGNVARAIERNQKAGKPDRLREPRDAGRDAQLPAEAAGGEEHRRRSGQIQPRARRHSGRAVFRRGQDDAARWT